MTEPKEVDGWNVAELAGGLLLSADDFLIQLDTAQVDQLLAVLNTGEDGEVRDSKGNIVKISSPNRDHVILTRVGDKTYPNGIILPVTAFSKLESEKTPVIEEVRPVFRREGGAIKHSFKKSKDSGRRMWRIAEQ